MKHQWDYTNEGYSIDPEDHIEERSMKMWEIELDEAFWTGVGAGVLGAVVFMFAGLALLQYYV